MAHRGGRGQLSGVSFLLPPWGFRIELMSSGFPGQAPLPAETSYWPFLLDVDLAPVLLASGNF